MSQQSFVQSKSLSQSEMETMVRALSLNTNMNQLEEHERLLLKTYLSVDLNEFFQSKLDSNLFEEIDEQDKSRFIGDFFSWIRNVFSTKSQPKKVEE
jgi:hypothetical protein